MEGKSNGTPIFVFDGLSAGFKSHPRTYIACETELSPFLITTSAERVIKIHRWTVLQGVRFLWFSWLMSGRRLDRHLNFIQPE